jgi:hypothetical protein
MFFINDSHFIILNYMKEEKFHIFPGTIKIYIFRVIEQVALMLLPPHVFAFSAILLLLIAGIKMSGLGVSSDGSFHSRFCRN